jgi:hypothetical protein
MMTAQSINDSKYYASGVDCLTLTQILHLWTEHGIPIISHRFSDSQSLSPSIKNRIYRGTAVALLATKYYLTAHMARDGEIDLSYVPTAEKLANCFTKPLPKPAFLKQRAAMGMIRIEHRYGLVTLGHARRNAIRIGIGNAIGTAVAKYIDQVHLFPRDS